ncbi:YopX protein [Lacticaseibacillus paracasei]|uniref:YopX family protein n=1 Tax=Lacticaseibacillus paracasei TaxID=1597 RepID=UPI000FEE2429|nr:YopX family protein [Lacticaseibacillus paracasei]RNE38829.1 YopX protein [Lacticaseibacillus paracasei]
MKREIKFRAFLNSKYYEKPRMLSWGELLEQYDAIDMFQRDLMTLMQYAGLHDKNGREIYESDILKVTGEDGESYVATVKWFGDEDYPAFDLEGIPAAWNYDANALATIFQSGVETCEVIGNIFEDKQLMEAQHE